MITMYCSAKEMVVMTREVFKQLLNCPSTSDILTEFGQGATNRARMASVYSFNRILGPMIGESVTAPYMLVQNHGSKMSLWFAVPTTETVSLNGHFHIILRVGGRAK